MRSVYRRGVLIAGVAAAVGCAGGRSGGVAPTTYTQTLGTVTATDLVREARDFLLRSQYEIEREETSQIDYILFLTRWRSRRPFQDEIDSGVVEARTRLTISGRVRKPPAGGSPALLVGTFSAENLVRFADSDEWRVGAITPMVREYLDEMVRRLRLELEQGIRIR